ncbi:MAG: type II toxin-antitoxin system PemK/MazF family toxin [Defluviitaleaceae bacterium]|nr:type II toxin-antitoxin system PemK/MazF family toxin [Defluviitaleaceae bacterium]
MVKQGSIIKINFDPTIGSEQAGYRPGVVISNNFVISKTNIITICPITTRQGKTALNVLLDDRTATQGAVLCAHNKAIDISKRPYTIIEELPQDKLEEIVNTIISMIEPS